MEVVFSLQSKSQKIENEQEAEFMFSSFSLSPFSLLFKKQEVKKKKNKKKEGLLMSPGLSHKDINKEREKKIY